MKELGQLDDFEHLAELAYKQEELSDFAPLPTKYMYLRLSMLYDCYARGKYSKAKCVQLKNDLRIEYKKIMEEHARNFEYYKESLVKRQENIMLLLKLEKSTNKDEMLDVCLKIVGNCFSDNSLHNRNISKFEQLAF